MTTKLSSLYIPSVRALIGALRSYGPCLNARAFPDETPVLSRTLNYLEDQIRKADSEFLARITVTLPYSADEIRFVLDEAYSDMRKTCENLRVPMPVEKAAANRDARSSVIG
jgi:hypothetical protein